MAEDQEDRFRGGKRYARDRHYGIDDRMFWRWWHRQEKDKYGIENLDKQQAEALHDLWKKSGRPEG